MEYTVLARSCRPQVFGEVVGQDHVVRTLRNAVRSNRIAHAYLFSGPRGTGKTTIARIMAKVLNCDRPADGEPCDRCTVCREIRDGISIDVREIDGASNRGIDEIRELKENVRFAPVASKYKIYIIDEVHMLTKEAFNALLKTLEEPPPHVIFMFATTEIHKVPPTILSRCQHFDLKRISVGQIVESLAAIAKRENITISPRGLGLIARSSDGSLRDAQSLLDQAIAYAGTTIADGDIENILGITDRRYATRVIQALLDGGASDCLEIVDEMYGAGEDISRFYLTLVRFMMGLLTAVISNNDELLSDFSEDEREDLRRLASGTRVETLKRLLEVMLAGEEGMRRASDQRIMLEYLLVKTASIEPVIPVDEMIARLENLERRLGAAVHGRSAAGTESSGESAVKSRGIEEPAPASGPEDSWEPLVPSGEGHAEVGDTWPRFMEGLKRADHILASKLTGAVCLGMEGDILAVGVPRGYVFLDRLCEPKALALMERVASECAGREMKVKIRETDGRNGENGEAGEGKERRSPEEIKSEALRHPGVQKVIDLFEGAEVRDVRLKNGGKPGEGG